MHEIQRLSDQITKENTNLSTLNNQIELLNSNQVQGQYSNGVWILSSNEDVSGNIQDAKKRADTISKRKARNKKDVLQLFTVWRKNQDSMNKIANNSDSVS